MTGGTRRDVIEELREMLQTAAREGWPEPKRSREIQRICRAAGRPRRMQRMYYRCITYTIIGALFSIGLFWPKWSVIIGAWVLWAAFWLGLAWLFRREWRR